MGSSRLYSELLVGVHPVENSLQELVIRKALTHILHSTQLDSTRWIPSQELTWM